MHAEHGSPLLRAILRHVEDVVTVVAPDGRLLFVSDTGGSALGQLRQDLTGTDALGHVHPDDRTAASSRRAWLLAQPGRTSRCVLRARTPEGGWRHYESLGINLVDDPEVQGLLYLTRDVEDRARAEMSLAHALGAARAVAELAQLALRVVDVDEVVGDALGHVRSLLGTACATLLVAYGDDLRVHRQLGPEPLPPGTAWEAGEGTSARAVLVGGREAVRTGWSLPGSAGPRIDDDAQEGLGEALALGLPVPAVLRERGLVAGLEVPLTGPAGTIGVLGAHADEPRPFSDIDVEFLSGVADVLAGALVRVEQERTALERAMHDPLTGLPTRSLLTDRLEHALERARRGAGEVAVLLVDLDRFKQVNDEWGHAAGDEVLRVLGPRLAACARTSDTVARYGGDEFVLLCEGDVTADGVARVAAAVQRACAEPVTLSFGESVQLSGSTGTAWSGEHGSDADALLAAADAAMYRDKARDRG